METKTKEVNLDNVNFTGAEIFKSDLKNVDFSNSNIDETKFDEYSIKGIYIDTFQCKNLVGMLGVKVKE